MGVLNLYDSIKVLEKNGINTGEYIFVKSLKEIEYAKKFLEKNKKAVLKVVSDKIIHKTEVGGVKIVSNEEELEKHLKSFFEIEGIKGVLIQKFYKGLEIFLSIKKDFTFGRVIAIGLGGIFFDILRDVCFLPIDFRKEELYRAIERTSIKYFVRGFRGIKIEFNELYNFLKKISKIKGEFKVLEINPLIYSEEGLIPVDVRIEKDD